MRTNQRSRLPTSQLPISCHQNWSVFHFHKKGICTLSDKAKKFIPLSISSWSYLAGFLGLVHYKISVSSKSLKSHHTATALNLLNDGSFNATKQSLLAHKLSHILQGSSMIHQEISALFSHKHTHPHFSPGLLTSTHTSDFPSKHQLPPATVGLLKSPCQLAHFLLWLVKGQHLMLCLFCKS